MKFAKWLSGLLKRIGGICLLGMMLLTVADVIGSLFGYPILGAEELVGLMASVLLAFALPSTQLEKGHIGVDLLYMRFSPRLKRVNDSAVSLISSVFFVLVGWQCFLYAGELRRVGEVSATLRFPAYYLIYGIAVATVILSYVIFIEFLTGLKGGPSND